MDATVIAILGLVLGLIGAVVGSFAYLMGEIRKSGVTARRDVENSREYILGRLENLSQKEAQERQNLRIEFVQTTGRVESDLRKLSDNVVRREDMSQLEQRITRSNDRLERKFDAIQGRLTPFLRPSPSQDDD